MFLPGCLEKVKHESNNDWLKICTEPCKQAVQEQKLIRPCKNLSRPVKMGPKGWKFLFDIKFVSTQHILLLVQLHMLFSNPFL